MPKRSDPVRDSLRTNRESERNRRAGTSRTGLTIGALEARPARRDARFASAREPRRGVDREGGSPSTPQTRTRDSRVNWRGGSGSPVGQFRGGRRGLGDAVTRLGLPCPEPACLARTALGASPTSIPPSADPTPTVAAWSARRVAW